jgi:hypothetical protein
MVILAVDLIPHISTVHLHWTRTVAVRRPMAARGPGVVTTECGRPESSTVRMRANVDVMGGWCDGMSVREPDAGSSLDLRVEPCGVSKDENAHEKNEARLS